MKTFAVIGAGYGDEGKGLMTDYLSKKYNSNIVGRFNGGAQAGHTVITKNLRKVFHHVSSGTFNDADTYLGSEFIVNPYLLGKELDELKALGYTPKIYCSGDARITTIYDMAINAIAELSRDNKHGSCGIGINETATRTSTISYDSINKVSDLFNTKSALSNHMKYIHTNWVPDRLAKLNINNIPTEFHEKTGYVLLNDNYDAHIEQILKVLDYIVVVPNLDKENTHGLILEGAQGLALDEELGEFPYVTRSLTGLPYAIKSANQLGYTEIQPVYISRCYTTRHGAGPLQYEKETITDVGLFDFTNTENEWQGEIRYAPLNLKYIKELINKDLNRASNSRVKILPPELAITCLDQIGNFLDVYDTNGEKRTLYDAAQTVNFISKELEIPVRYSCFGPNANTVVDLFSHT
jgi:adenylosuccinate synthase